MAKIHYCTCRVNLSGQNLHIVHYDQFNPVTWPEVQVLMALHGDENVMDVIPVRIGEVAAVQEKDRLIAQYGLRIVEQCFPGRNFRMALMMTDDDTLPRIGAVEDEDHSAEAAALAAQTATFKPARSGKEA